MKSPETKPAADGMMCPCCAEALNQVQVKKPFLSFIFGSPKVLCPKCGRNCELGETRIMAQSFEHWADQLRHQVEASVSYLPAMTREECFAVLNPKHFDDDVHQLHRLRDLLHYATEVFKPVLRDRALGHQDCELLISPQQQQGIAKGLNIYGHCGFERSTEAWTLLITRLGPKEFLTYLTISGARANLTTILETPGAVSIWPGAGAPAPRHDPRRN